MIDAAKAVAPVSVKTRIGFTEMAEMEAWITHLLETRHCESIHSLRTRKDEQSGCPWEVIPQIGIRDRVAPQTTIINGDIPDRQRA